MHRVKVKVPDDQASLKRDCMEFKRHNGQIVTVLREWGGDKLLIRGDAQGPREYDIIPKEWATKEAT